MTPPRDDRRCVRSRSARSRRRTSVTAWVTRTSSSTAVLRYAGRPVARGARGRRRNREGDPGVRRARHRGHRTRTRRRHGASAGADDARPAGAALVVGPSRRSAPTAGSTCSTPPRPGTGRIRRRGGAGPSSCSSPGGVLALFGRPARPRDPELAAVVDEIEQRVLPGRRRAGRRAVVDRGHRPRRRPHRCRAARPAECRDRRPPPIGWRGWPPRPPISSSVRRNAPRRCSQIRAALPGPGRHRHHGRGLTLARRV